MCKVPIFVEQCTSADLVVEYIYIFTCRSTGSENVSGRDWWELI